MKSFFFPSKKLIWPHVQQTNALNLFDVDRTDHYWNYRLINVLISLLMTLKLGIGTA